MYEEHLTQGLGTVGAHQFWLSFPASMDSCQVGFRERPDKMKADWRKMLSESKDEAEE